MTNHGERTRDPLFSCRSVNKGFNSKKDELNPQGGERWQLTIGGDKDRGNQAIDELIATLTAHRENPRGVKLDIHVSKKAYNGRTFDSGFFFVRPVQDAPGGAFGGQNVRYVPKQVPAVDAAVASFKAQQIKG